MFNSFEAAYFRKFWHHGGILVAQQGHRFQCQPRNKRNHWCICWGLWQSHHLKLRYLKENLQHVPIFAGFTSVPNKTCPAAISTWAASALLNTASPGSRSSAGRGSEYFFLLKMRGETYHFWRFSMFQPFFGSSPGLFNKSWPTSTGIEAPSTTQVSRDKATCRT